MVSKKGVISLMIAVLSISGCLVRLPEPTRHLTAEEVAQRLKNSTVKIYVARRTSNNSIRYSTGSGFVFKRGYIATNEHVIRDMDIKLSKVSITGQSRKYTIQLIEGIDVDYDIAIIRCAQIKAVPLVLGNNKRIRLGETIYVTGAPKGYSGTFTTGVISAVRDDEFKNSDDVIQFSAPTSPGSSGSPLVNSKAEVIGIVRSHAHGGQNINFASPVNALKYLIQRSM